PLRDVSEVLPIRGVCAPWPGTGHQDACQEYNQRWTESETQALCHGIVLSCLRWQRRHGCCVVWPPSAALPASATRHPSLTVSRFVGAENRCKPCPAPLRYCHEHTTKGEAHPCRCARPSTTSAPSTRVTPPSRRGGGTTVHAHVPRARARMSPPGVWTTTAPRAHTPGVAPWIDVYRWWPLAYRCTRGP